MSTDLVTFLHAAAQAAEVAQYPTRVEIGFGGVKVIAEWKRGNYWAAQMVSLEEIAVAADPADLIRHAVGRANEICRNAQRSRGTSS